MKIKSLTLGVVILIVFAITMVVMVIVGDRTYTYSPIFDEPMPESATTTFDIAPVSSALTFARYEFESQVRLLLVQSYTSEWITGIDLNAALETSETDILAIFEREGYANLAALPDTSEAIRIASDRLIIPLDTNDRHIAMGGNYPEHGEEVEIETPWIFPKIVQPTAANDDLSLRETTLLDYEVELGLVLLDDLRKEDGFPPHIGLILVDDYTDRERLVRYTNPLGDEPCQGCTEGKSREGYLPIGNLIVIPQEFDAFYPQIELRLYVNQQLRQRTTASQLTLNPSEIIDFMWENIEALYGYRGKQVPLSTAADFVPSGTIILTGTPAGVVFRPPSSQQILAGIPDYIFSFDWSNRSVLDAYFQGARESEAFLSEGDQIITGADYLGILHQTIVPWRDSTNRIGPRSGCESVG